MKLYFAFSNSVLFNQANIQEIECEKEADLLVWATPPIDLRLVDKIKDFDFFRNIWYLERPKIIEGKKIRKFKSNKIVQNFYNAYLSKILNDKLYDEFIVAGFWNDTIYIVNYLKSINPHIKISICEEGLLNYYCGEAHKNLYYMVQNNKRQNLKSWCLGGRTFKFIQKNIITDYLNAPSFLKYKFNNNIIKIPNYSNTTDRIRGLVNAVFDCVPVEIYEEYKKRNVFYIASEWNRNYDPIDVNPTILQCIEEIVPPDKLVIKTHTNATQHRMTYAKDTNKKVYVDRAIYLFEILCSQLELDNKIFILRNSSIALNLTQYFEKEPIFIFTHRLFSRYHYGLDDCGDQYIEDLRKHMKNPDHVLVPNSILDLKCVLINLCETYCGGVRIEERSDDEELSPMIQKILETFECLKAEESK